MDQVLGQEALKFTTVYVDDLLITSTNWEEHCRRVDHVLNKLSENHITLKLEKSQLIAKEVQFLGYSITVRTDHKSISFLKNCKLSHGRLARWTLVLQEYNISWEYVPGKKNIAADTLSRINITNQTYEGEKETIVKVYNILKSRTELEDIVKEVEQRQRQDSKLMQIFQRLNAQDNRIIPHYCIHNDVLFIKTKYHNNTWKLVIHKTLEKDIKTDYHIRYGHMGAVKAVSYTHLDVYKRQV